MPDVVLGTRGYKRELNKFPTHATYSLMRRDRQ